MNILCIGKDGAVLKEKRPDPFADGSEKEVEISEYSREDFPLEAPMRLQSIDIEGETVRIEFQPDSGTFAESETTENGFWNDIQQSLGIEKEEEQISLNNSKTAAANYRDFLDYLYNHGELEESKLPIQLPNARSRYLINTEPVHMDGGEMVKSYEVAEGIHAETNFSAERIKRNIRIIGEQLRD